jgi:hypothetical protein
MQDDVITLAVDELNNDTPVDYDFTRYEEYQNRSVYIGEDHDLASPDTLTLYRTFPKPSGNYKGNAKSTLKFSKAYEVTGVDGVSTLTAPYILEISHSIPVGVAAADRMIMRQRAIAILDSDAFMELLTAQLMV